MNKKNNRTAIWIVSVLLFFSALLNGLQLLDRMYLRRENNQLQLTGGTKDFKIEPKDTATVGLYHSKHKKAKKS
jgi:hypothetical protein